MEARRGSRVATRSNLEFDWMRGGKKLRAFIVGSLFVVTGCATTEKITSLKIAPTGKPVEMAVIAEPRTANQNGQAVLGLVVQVLLLDPAGQPLPADGGLSFSLYVDDALHSETVEADRQWKFSAEQVEKSAVSIPLGVVHNFWLPLSGPLAGAPRIKMLTAYTSTDASQFTQWNRIHTAPKTMKIEHTSDVEELKAAMAPEAEPTGNSQTP